MRHGLRDLLAVAVLAEERHFGRTADRLGMAQPQLSELIARVEATAGIRMFERRPHVKVTPAGTVIVDAARHILSELDHSLETARRVQAGQEGVVRIGIVDAVMLTDLPLAFTGFRQNNPHVQFSFRDMHSMGLVKAVEADLCDVAFARQRAVDTKMSMAPVYSEPLIMVSSDLTTSVGKDPFDLDDFAKQPFILFPPELAPTLHGEILAACAAAGFRPHVAHLAKGWLPALALVRSGFGVTIGPKCLERLNWPGLMFADLADNDIRSTIYMLWKEQQLTPAAQGFVRSILSSTEQRLAP